MTRMVYRVSQVTCRFLSEESTKALTEKEFIPAVRKFLMRHLLSGFPFKCFMYINQLRPPKNMPVACV